MCFWVLAENSFLYFWIRVTGALAEIKLDAFLVCSRNVRIGILLHLNWMISCPPFSQMLLTALESAGTMVPLCSVSLVSCSHQGHSPACGLCETMVSGLCRHSLLLGSSAFSENGDGALQLWYTQYSWGFFWLFGFGGCSPPQTFITCTIEPIKRMAKD